MNVTVISGDPKKIKNTSNDWCVYPETLYLHPKLQVEYVNNLIIDNRKEDNTIITNSDHIINALRVARKNSKINDLVIYFYLFNSDERIEIKSDKDGRFNIYPNDFMDEWSNQLSQLI